MCLVLFLFGPYRHILRELSVRTEHYEYYCIVYTKRDYTYVTNNVCLVVVRVMCMMISYYLLHRSPITKRKIPVETFS